LEGQRAGKIAHGEVHLHFSILPPYRDHKHFRQIRTGLSPDACYRSTDCGHSPNGRENCRRVTQTARSARETEQSQTS
jgi:hypothetical protein